MAAADVDPARRNEQLIAGLQETGALRDAAVTAAFRAVLRHRFLPDTPLDEVYEDSAIPTKTGEHGIPVSSSSQPAIMAIMLQLLGVEPGQRVLEIGAGTGYNAALLAHLAGPAGRVVTLDIDEEIVSRARANLAAAAVTGVEVRAGDGAAGWPPGAPYDRIVVTAGADDLAPAWRDQLVEGGRLVVPLALAGPWQQCVAFVRRGRVLTDGRLCPCGFMPLRGAAAPGAIRPDEELSAWLAGEGRPTGHAVEAGDLRAGFEVWLALTHEGYARAADPAGAFGLRHEDGAGLVMERGSAHQVVAFGGGAAAERLVRAHREWRRDRPLLDRLRVAAHPSADAPPPVPPGGRTLRRARFTFVVRSA